MAYTLAYIGPVTVRVAGVNATAAAATAVIGTQAAAIGAAIQKITGDHDPLETDRYLIQRLGFGRWQVREPGIHDPMPIPGHGRHSTFLTRRGAARAAARTYPD